MKIEIRKTQDGSQTIYADEIGEHYHSTFGAIGESKHVFIGEGLNQCPQKEILVFEIGFGTGLNCFLTSLMALSNEKLITYYSIEKYPLPKSIWKDLTYSSHFPQTNPELFRLLHSSPWNRKIEIHDHFFLCKMKGDLLRLKFLDLPLFDLVYFDAFSPEKQPEMWDSLVFEKLYSRMKMGGILVTYCAKGKIRRTLQSVGFYVERIPGPPGKREMIRARKLIGDYKIGDWHDSPNTN